MRPVHWLVDRMGGWRRARVILVLASVLALDGADAGAVGAMAGPLEKGLGISKTQVGLMLTLSLALGAVATLPFGWLVDRVQRTRLLAIVVAFWGASMLLAGAATSYEFLLLTRLGLAGVSACAVPAVASLLGDSFAIEERAKIFGYVIAGEFIGAGFGFVVAGELAAWSWRAGFVALAVPTVFAIWGLRKTAEPARGGADRLAPPRPLGEGRELFQMARRRHIPPREKLLFRAEPRRRSLLWAALYVVRVPTSAILILASSCGYFFLAGVRAFGVQFVHQRFGVAHATATILIVAIGLGALAGVLVCGPLADLRVRRGHLRGRIELGLAAYLLVCLLFLPGLLFDSL